MTSRLREFLLPFAYFSNNLISRVGVLLVTAATVFWIFLLPQLLHGATSNPYIGLLLFFGLPAVFIGGLLLIPVGVFFARRKAHAQGLADPVVFDFRDLAVRRLLLFITLATFVNIVIASQLSYSAVQYMETSHFCGQVCHVMNPEFTAYKNSPHSNVGCSECHVGPGASGFVMAKLAGTRQLISLSTGTYPRPIPPPEHMLPATETCERCHSPERFVGDRLIVHHEFAEDEANSATSTVLRMKVGGGRAGIGIHGAHMRAGVTIQYLTTGEGRKEIPQVSKIEPNGKITVFKATDSKLTPAQLATGVTRRMDCMDCHNRPTHVFQTPERALDQALASGEISVALPFLKREALAALRANYADRDTAAREIETRLNNFYRTNHAQLFQTDSGKVQGAVAAVQAIYARNVFPEMKVTWGTYPSQLGHTDAPGCFRCHDGSHTSADGRTISNDCATCHEVPAMQEKNPKILSNLGIALPPAVASASDKP